MQRPSGWGRATLGAELPTCRGPGCSGRLMARCPMQSEGRRIPRCGSIAHQRRLMLQHRRLDGRDARERSRGVASIRAWQLICFAGVDE